MMTMLVRAVQNIVPLEYCVVDGSEPSSSHADHPQGYATLRPLNLQIKNSDNQYKFDSECKTNCFRTLSLSRKNESSFHGYVRSTFFLTIKFTFSILKMQSLSTKLTNNRTNCSWHEYHRAHEKYWCTTNISAWLVHSCSFVDGFNWWYWSCQILAEYNTVVVLNQQQMDAIWRPQSLPSRCNRVLPHWRLQSS